MLSEDLCKEITDRQEVIGRERESLREVKVKNTSYSTLTKIKFLWEMSPICS